MKKLNHTPGPWYVSFYQATPEFKAHNEHIAITNNSYELIALTGPTLDGPTAADARLIAAAPDLLSAANYALDCLNAAQEVCGDDTLWAGCVLDLQEAMAKAEGDSE